MVVNRADPNVPFRRFLAVLITLGLLIFVFTVYNNGDSSNLETLKSRLRYPSNQTGFTKQLANYDLNEYNVKTYNGYVTMNELNEKVYKLLGYEIELPTLPVPTLRMINEPTCELVFTEWLKVSQQPQPDKPQRTIPSQDSNAFLLFGYAALGKWYINDKNSLFGEKPRNWDRISELMNYSKDQLGRMAYYKDSVSMYHAMAANRLDGKSGVVIGSMQPWVEVMALKNGAKSVLTVEYNPLKIQNEFKDRMSAILPSEFVKNYRDYYEKFDFAASFSSIEHSGLGRYGDPLDPIGDLREMLKIKCILKKGGLLFLAFPLGTDAIQYNAHRIYGPVRLALMFYGFEWLSTFNGEQEQSFDLNSLNLHSKVKFQQAQYTMVLRKL
ncbi:hypothetical protein B9Z55_019874 [Caenorhabditis nigoni]|uniref:Uncharacterized protein n=1 Tax=Caenorhabditis nigoni TaxID=1611254 RepID=A0A2G5TK88_9PELO|nr:hypothetical protein B9Z55_019874 [Caenorhabditis nigoni]